MRRKRTFTEIECPCCGESIFIDIDPEGAVTVYDRVDIRPATRRDMQRARVIFGGKEEKTRDGKKD